MAFFRYFERLTDLNWKYLGFGSTPQIAVAGIKPNKSCSVILRRGTFRNMLTYVGTVIG
jgi:hypothetical protein